MMNNLDLFGHIGYFFILLGLLFLARQNRLGWFLRLIGEVIWVALGVKMGMTSIWLWGLIFMSIDVYAYFKWREQ